MSATPRHGEPGITEDGRVPPAAIECRDLAFDYADAGAPVAALRGVSLTVAPGGSLALLGPTGSGKSTLLQVIRGLLPPLHGEVVLGGLRRGSEEYAERQRHIGLVFQRPELQLFAATVLDDVAFGPRQFGRADDEVVDSAHEALAAVGLPVERFGRRHPHSLSGGEQRRAALAGVLAMRPDALLLDEPFVGLDPGARRDFAAILADLSTTNVAIVLATHDLDVAWELCESRLILDAGRIVAAGRWAFGQGGEDVLTAHRLQVPFLVRLWARLGRSPGDVPRTLAEAGAAL